MDVELNRSNAFESPVIHSPVVQCERFQTVPSDPIETNVPPRDVIRCQRCQLVQFRTISGCCRRCWKPLPPKLAVVPRSVSAEESSHALAGPSPFRTPAPVFLSKLHFEKPKIGGVLQRLRSQRGMTQVQLARSAGIPRSYVSRIEHDHLLPGPWIAFRLAAALAVDILDLLPREPECASDASLAKDPNCAQLFREFSRLSLPEMAAVLLEVRHMLEGNAVSITQPRFERSSPGEKRVAIG